MKLSSKKVLIGGAITALIYYSRASIKIGNVNNSLKQIPYEVTLGLKKIKSTFDRKEGNFIVAEYYGKIFKLDEVGGIYHFSIISKRSNKVLAYQAVTFKHLSIDDVGYIPFVPDKVVTRIIQNSY